MREKKRKNEKNNKENSNQQHLRFLITYKKKIKHHNKRMK